AMPKSTRRRGSLRVWVYGLGGAAAAAMLLFVLAVPSLLRSRQPAFEPRTSGLSALPPEERPGFEGMTPEQQGQRGQPPQQRQAATQNQPMVIRRIMLTLITKEFDSARSRIDALVQQFQGYIDNLPLRADAGSARALAATLRIPANQADSALNE